MDILNNYQLSFNNAQVESKISHARKKVAQMHTIENLKMALGLIDLTTLNSIDQYDKGVQFANHVNGFKKIYPELPDVAAICVYPPIVKAVAGTLKVPGVGIASVAAGFPSSQTYLDVKILECQKAVHDGATEIDIVISLGTWLSGDYQTVFDEIKAIKKAIQPVHLKVILETGALPSINHIWDASFISMEAGADFIKTSTGKMEPAATPEAVCIMCEAIKMYYHKTGKIVGLKPAGGIITSSDALLYMAIVEDILGKNWLSNRYFRLGASRLANNLVKDILALQGIEVADVKYF
jgi:deoxyribose-phosphate aldolase